MKWASAKSCASVTANGVVILDTSTVSLDSVADSKVKLMRVGTTANERSRAKG